MAGSAMPDPTFASDPAHVASTIAWRKVALVTTALGVVLGLLGPFGSFASPGLAWRMGYWIAVIWLGLLIYGGLMVVAQRPLSGQGPRGWLTFAGLIAIGSIPQAWASRALAFTIWPSLPGFAPPVWLWYLQVSLIAMLIGATVRLWRGYVLPMPRDGKVSPQASDPWPDDIIALQMEDHYVRIHRPGGSDLVLMTLRDAMARVAQMDGLQVHRSWWVARSAITTIAGDSRAMRLQLTDGLVVPVARNRIAILRAAGWLG
jgi:hypothetical protein